jgi:hypothetical protein
MSDEELFQRLIASDPTFLGRLGAYEERVRRFDDDAAPVLADLWAAGVQVDELNELRKPGAPLRAAVPVLARWLPSLEYPPVKHDVVMTLGHAKGDAQAARALLAEFRRIDPATDTDVTTGLRAAIGSALAMCATDEVADDLIELAADRHHGQHRLFVVLALGNMKKRRARAVSTLVELLEDDDVADCAVRALVRLHAHEVRDHVEAMRDHANPAVRAEVRAALKKWPT